MARETPETLCFAPCPGCRGQVAVKLNISRLAYANCDHCGLQIQHKWKRTSDAFVDQHVPKPAPAPASTPAAPAPIPTKTEKPARTGFFGATLLG